MKQLHISTDSGTPIYYVDEKGQLQGSLLYAFQVYVNNNFGEFARAVATVGSAGGKKKKRKVQIALQVDGHLLFAAISDQGEPASELDTELQLAHDLLGLSVGPKAFRSKNVRLWKNKGHHASFLRLVDTAMSLCTRYPSVLVRSLEQLETNQGIRIACAKALKSHYEELPEFKGAVVFVGTRVLAQYQPGDTIKENTTDLGRSEHKSGLSVYDFFLLMLHVQSIFNPVLRPKKEQPPKPAEGEDGDGTTAEGTPDEDDGAAPTIPTSPSPPSSSSSSSSTMQSQRIQATKVSGEKSGRPVETTEEIYYKYKGKQVRSLEGLAENLAGGLLANWLPGYVRDFAYVSQVYLQNDTPCVVYCAEIMEGIYIAVALGISDKEVLKQRNILVRAHMSYGDWLKKDYAAFLLTKLEAHMPMLSYISSVPGIVHFIYVDRLKNFAIAPSVAPLYGQDSRVTHTADSLTRLIYRLVHYAHTHLAYGCTTMMVKANGFHFSYKLSIEDDGEALPDFRKVIEKGDMPWVVSPKLYGALISHKKAKKCYELYTLYLGSVPISAIAQKNRQLLKELSILSGYPIYL